MHNGEIQYYLIVVIVTESGEQFQLTSETTALTIGDIHPFYNYIILISAVTTDMGPYSLPVHITTPADSKFTKQIFGLALFSFFFNNFTFSNSLFVAPSGPPTDVNVTALSSTSLLVTWQPPELLERNGIITAYQIHVTTFGEETSNIYTVSGNTLSLQVKGNCALFFQMNGSDETNL